MYIKYCEKSEIVYTDWIVLFKVLKKLPFQFCMSGCFSCGIVGQKCGQVCNSLTKKLSVVSKTLQQNTEFKLPQE